jgi:hypothetical protein
MPWEENVCIAIIFNLNSMTIELKNNTFKTSQKCTNLYNQIITQRFCWNNSLHVTKGHQLVSFPHFLTVPPFLRKLISEDNS